MPRLALDGGATRNLLHLLLGSPDLAKVVPSLDPQVLHQLVRHIGLEECGEIVALATPQQLTQIFDDDLWNSDTPGTEEQFDADRFGLWLEVLEETGDAVAAQKLVAMDMDFVTAALSRQFLVLDGEMLMMLRISVEAGGDLDAPVRRALAELALEDRESCEIGGYMVIAKRTASWDALLSVLTSLHRRHPVFFGEVMKRCCQISTEYITDNGGLWDVLTADEQIMADVAGAREERREQQGFVAPLAAVAFLKIARQQSASDAPQGFDIPNQSRMPLLPAAPSSGRDPLSRIRAQLLFAQDQDAAAHARRAQELAYLANVLVAGCSFQSRRFRAGEAAEAALAVCNLGLENSEVPGHSLPADFLVHQQLLPVFQKGWRILYEDLSLFVAKSLVETLSGIRCDDLDTQNQIVDLCRRMTAQVAAGTPWRERDNLNVLAILDTPSWAMLENLIDECPVVPRNACMPVEKPPLRVATEFEFISENRQIAWARNFAESLPGRLR